MTASSAFIDPVATGDAMLMVRATALRKETDALLAGDKSAAARGNKIAVDNTVTVNAVANATRNTATPPGLMAWRDAYFTFRDTVQAMSTIQALPTVTVTEPMSLNGWKIPGTNVIVPWFALVAVAGFIGVAYYVVNKKKRGGNRG